MFNQEEEDAKEALFQADLAIRRAFDSYLWQLKVNRHFRSIAVRGKVDLEALRRHVDTKYYELY